MKQETEFLHALDTRRPGLVRGFRGVAAFLQRAQQFMVEPSRHRIDELRAQIAARLAPVCAGWPPETFDEMVRGIAAITLKYDLNPTSEYDRRSTERLISEIEQAVEQSIKLRKQGDAPETD